MIQRLKPVSRGTPPKRRTRIKARHRRRFKNSVRIPEKLDWIRRRVLCVISGDRAQPHHEPPLSRGGGDDRVVPLAPDKHEERHRIGLRAFERKYGANLAVIAADVHRHWLSWDAPQSAEYREHEPSDVLDNEGCQ